jgi:secondary thiamine-phosphate synthase enzyme
MIENHSFEINTRGFNDIVDITPQIADIIGKSELHNASVLVFGAGSTCGITTIEFESGAVADLKDCFERLAPMDMEYQHNLRWGDGNGFSHVRAALLKASFVFPVVEGRAVLGTWQQIVLVDFDNNSRRRKIFVQINGE